MSKLLSIIIPTRNRQIYCLESVRSIINDLDERCEIVVQDNSSDNSLEPMITGLNSSIITYNYNPTALSFIDNFEEALKLSTAKYFIILGDDDSTTKDILPIVEWMEREDVESVSSSHVVDYIWPNDKINKYKNGLMSVPDYKGWILDIDVEAKLIDLVKNGFLSYQSFNLPRTYHGIIKRSCMEQIKKITGRYFGGLTPDIYSTVALACVIRKHKVVDFPFSIAGACPASATVNATVGGHSGKLNDAPHLNNRGNYDWEQIIPRYYSVETIWAETAIKALKDMNYADWEKKFNKYKLYIYGILLNRKYIFWLSIKETLKLSRYLHTSRLLLLFKLICALVRIIFIKYIKINKNIGENKNDTYENIISLNDCKRQIYQDIENVKKFYEVTI